MSLNFRNNVWRSLKKHFKLLSSPQQKLMNIIITYLSLLPKLTKNPRTSILIFVLLTYKNKPMNNLFLFAKSNNKESQNSRPYLINFLDHATVSRPHL